MNKFVYTFILGILFLLVSNVNQNVYADNNYKLELQYSDISLIENNSINIYKIGTVNNTNRIILNRDYDYLYKIINKKNLNIKKIHELTDTIYNFTKNNNIQRYKTVNGKVNKFHFDKLKKGLYLVDSVSYENNYYIYKSKPFMVQIPYTKNNYIKDKIKLNLKFEKTSKNKNNKKYNKLIYKIWENSDEENFPKITIEIKKNGKKFKKINLSKNNNWRYLLKNLDEKAEYSFFEKNIPEHYKVNLEDFKTTLIVTNTKENNEKKDVDNKNLNKDKKNLGKEEIDDKNQNQGVREKQVKNQKTDKNTTIKADKLPQTGKQWWQKYLLFSLALLLFFSAKIRKNNILYFLSLFCLLSSFYFIFINTSQEKYATEEAQKILIEYKEIKQEEVTINKIIKEKKNILSRIEIEKNIFIIGDLYIPKIDINLPIIDEWNYDKLNKSICRYKGSPYKDNFVIMGHNYTNHFGKIKQLQIGDEVAFTTTDDEIFVYEVVNKRIINSTEKTEVNQGELILFTCDLNNTKRVLIECKKKE